jgi:hypothetical protein
MWMLVVLAAVTAMMAAVTVQLMTSRRWLNQRENQFQALWLARSGVELAAARLTKDPANYTGESAELIPASELRIEVHSEPGSPNTFLVTSEAHYPTDGRPLVVRSLQRQLRRTIDKDRVRIEAVNADER